MSRSKKTPYIIAYDIGNPKRLVKIHRFLKKQAMPLQYSVFYAKLSKPELETLIKALDNRIVDAEDDIRIYPLPQKPSWSSFGKALWSNTFFGDDSLPQAHHKIE